MGHVRPACLLWPPLRLPFLLLRGRPRGSLSPPPSLFHSPGDNDNAIDELEKRGFVVFSTDMECCLWAYHDRLRATHALKSSFWRKQSGEEMKMADLLEYVGASKNPQMCIGP